MQLLPLNFIDWCDANGIERMYIQPGTPSQNAFIERFNRSYRTEVLNHYLFVTLKQVRDLSALCRSATTNRGRMTLWSNHHRQSIYFQTVRLTGKLTHSSLLPLRFIPVSKSCLLVVTLRQNHVFNLTISCKTAQKVRLITVLIIAF